MALWDELNGEQSLPAEPDLWPSDRAPVQITVRPPRAAPPDEGVPGWATPARPPMSYEPQTDGMWQSLMTQGETPQPNLWPQPAPPAEPYERSAFEAAALRNRAPYRNLPAPGSSNMEAVADALVPKEPWEYGLMAASPGLGLIGRGIATLPRAVRAGATMAGFALTPEQAEAASKRALLEKMLGRSEAAKGFDTSSPEAQRLLFGGTHGPDTPEANWMIRYAKDGTPQLVDISRAKGTGPSHHAFSDVRTGKPIDEMSFKTSGTPPPEGNVFDIADLQKQNAYIMPGVTDPTWGVKGGTLDEVGGRVFEKPVPLEGGRNYSAIQADNPVPGLPDAQRLFANQKGPVTGILKDARRVQDLGGVPYFSTVRMATQSMSSSPQVAQSVYQSIKAMNPSEELAGIFDAAVMKELGGKVNKKAGPYPGVSSPDLEAWLNKVSGPYRDKFVSALDAKSVLRAGGPDIGEIRYANTDPRYRSTPTGGSGLFMGRIRPELGTAPSGHTGYPTAFLTGKGETGGLGGSVPFHTLQPDLWRHLMSKGGPKMGNLPAYYTMGQLPGGPLKAQKVTQEVVDNVSEFIRRNPKMWATLMGVGVGAGATAGGTGEAEAGPADIIRKGIEAAAPFFSTAQRAVENAKLTKGTPEQWLGYLRNQPGVKAEEMEWMFGNLPKEGTLTKAQMEAHAAANQVKLNEVVKGDTGEPFKFGTPEQQTAATQRFETARQRLLTSDPGSAEFATAAREHSEAERAMRDIVPGWGRAEEKVENPTKFNTWQLPGGENYRERLMTLPSEGGVGALDAARHKASTLGRQAADAMSDWKRLSEENTPGHPDTLAAYRRVFDTRKAANAARDEANELAIRQQETQFKSSHWDEPNVIAHTRMNDRNIPGVGKSLHLEEIQSDWHQAGRDRGYKSEEKALREDVIAKEREYNVASQLNRPDVQERLAAYQEAGRRLDSFEGGAVPDAPFKSTWADMSLKRSIREAAEKNYDALSWTPGKAQAERYQLSAQLKELQYQKHSDGTYEIGGTTKGDHGFNHPDRVTAAQLPDVVGKEMAEKILKGEGKRTRGQNYDGGYFDGIDLKVGGRGMEAFYDKMLVDKANALAKKHGARVEPGSIPVKKPTDAGAVSGNMVMTDLGIHPARQDAYWRNLTSEQREQLFADYRAEHVNQPVHVLRMTPQLREAAMKGFPLFSLGAGGAALAPGLFSGETEQAPNLWPQELRR